MIEETHVATANPAPLVTIIIPSYNHQDYVQAAIESVIAQEYPNIELIVIDDGSSDTSPARIRELEAKCSARLTRFECRLRANRGLCETLNEGIAWAQGEYLAVLDSDDVLLPHKTSRLVALLGSRNDLAGAFGGCILINEGGTVVGDIRPKERTYQFADILSRDKAFISSCMLVRLADVRRAGGYKTGLYIEDWYMWLKLTEGGASFQVISEPLVNYRLHGTNISRNARRMFEGRREILAAYPDHPQVPIALSSIWIQFAGDLARDSKAESIDCAWKALRVFPPIAARRFFWMTIARAITPRVILDVVSAMRRGTRTKTARLRAGA